MVNEQYSMIEKVRANAGAELSEIGESALQAFFDLPGSGDWSPDPHLPIQMFDPFNFGLPFALIGNEKSADELKKKIGREIANGNYPDRADLGEVHAGALLSNFGADVEFIMPRKDLKTPDIRASWPPDDLLDVEVTAPEILANHKEVMDTLKTLSEVISARDQDWHVIILFRDASDQSDVNAAIDKMTQLSPGESSEHKDRWFIIGLGPDQRDEVVGGKAIELFAPAWWPKDETTFNIVSTVISGQFSPVVMFQSLVPDVPYVNPISRKADRPQRDKSNPFMIAVDVFGLIGAHQRVVMELAEWFPTWDHVSAVMLFDERFIVGVRPKAWHISVHKNPHASIPLPKSFPSLPDGVEFPVEFKLTA